MTSEEKKDDPLVNLIDIILSRKLIIVIGFLSVFSIVTLGAIYMPPSYEAYSKIYIAPPTLPRVEVPYISDMSDRSFLANQIELIKSRSILSEIAKKLGRNNINIPLGYWTKFKDKLKDHIYSILKISRNIPDPQERIITILRNIIRVRLSRGTNIVSIFVATGSPRVSAKIANAIAEGYIDSANRIMSNKADSAYGYIEKEIENTGQKLYESEKALNKFKNRENVYSISTESSIITNKLAELEDEYNQIQLQIESPKKQIDSQELQALSNQLMTLKSQIDQLLVYHTDEHPDVKILHNRFSEIENKIIQAKSINDNNKNDISEKEINELELKRKNISKQIKKLKEKRSELSKKQVELDKKTSEYLSNRQKLASLTSKLENAGILKANEVKQGTIQMIERAVPPVWPDTKKKKILFAVGTIVALIFSFGMAFSAEYLDDSLKTPDEAEQYLKLPILGSVPKITRKLRKM